jgi:gamma-glutamylaminecyclotransferase
MEADGEVTIVNKNLGVEEDGIWYSNEYHVTRTYPTTTHNSSPYFNYYNRTTNTGATTKVFVYGTLKKGYSNHSFLSGAKFIGKAETCSTYLMIGKDMPFPYLLRYARASEGGLKIQGEVYEVSSDILAKLDMLEGVPHHYKKEEVYVVTDSNTCMPVQTYVKATIRESDLTHPFIGTFEKKSYTHTARSDSSYDNLVILTASQLADMGSIELAFYVETLEKAYYGRAFNTHRNYAATAEELIDEIEMLHDFILEDFQELMETHTTPFTPSHTLDLDYLDD